MKAYFINPFECSIKPVELSDDCDEQIDQMYTLLECRVFEAVRFGKYGDAVYVDEEFLLRDSFEKGCRWVLVHPSFYQPVYLMGKGLVIGCDLSTGDSRDVQVDLEVLVKWVFWENRE